MTWIVSVLVYLDGSGSMKPLYKMAIASNSTLIRSAIATVVEGISEEVGDKDSVRVYFFGVDHTLKPRFKPYKIGEFPNYFPKYSYTDLNAALRHAERIGKPEELVFIITDNIQEAVLANSLSLFYRKLRDYSVVMVLPVRFIKRAKAYAFVIYALKRSVDKRGLKANAQEVGSILRNLSEFLSATVDFEKTRFEAAPPLVLRPLIEYSLDFEVGRVPTTLQLRWPNRPYVVQKIDVNPIWRNPYLHPVGLEIRMGVREKITKGQDLFKNPNNISTYIYDNTKKRYLKVIKWRVVKRKEDSVFTPVKFWMWSALSEYAYTPLSFVYLLFNDRIRVGGVAYFRGSAREVVWDDSMLNAWGLDSNPRKILSKVPNLEGMSIVVRNSADDRIAGEWQAYRLNEIEVFVNQWHRTIVILSIAAAIFILLFILALAGRAMGGG